MGNDAVAAEMERVRADFRMLVSEASRTEQHARTDGTRWTNRQLLFHMLFGYLLVRVLLDLVKAFARLPRPVSRGFAAVLNAGTQPFHVVNYLSALPGASVLTPRAQARLMDSTLDRLVAALACESESSLSLGMHFPVGWDPYFHDVMAVADIYHYPTQHYDHHRRQLTTAAARPGGAPSGGATQRPGEEQHQAGEEGQHLDGGGPLND